MATVSETPKDKIPGNSGLKFVPRHTATSAARAAKIASNRSSLQHQNTTSTKSAPVRFSPVFRAKSASLRSDTKLIDQKVPPKTYEGGGIEDHITSGAAIAGAGESHEDIVVHIAPQPREASKSRPHTPARQSRLQAPTAISRPQTPNKTNNPVSHIQNNIKRQTQNKTKQDNSDNGDKSPTRTISRENASSPDKNDMIEVYKKKQQEFQTLKMDLDLRQQTVLKEFDSLKAMQNAIREEGVVIASDKTIQELMIVNVADWPAGEMAKLCQDAIATQWSDKDDFFKTFEPIDTIFVVEVSTEVVNIPTLFSNLCLHAFDKRQKLIDWLKDMCENDSFVPEQVYGKVLEYNNEGIELCNTLRSLKDRSDEVAKKCSEISRKFCQERDALVTVGETLLREVTKLRADTNAMKNQIDSFHHSNAQVTFSKQDQERPETAAKEKLEAVENQLRQARGRVNRMEKQLREADASIEQLTETVKTLEDQRRQKEVQFDARARKLKENLRSGELTTTQLAQQKNDLLAEVQNLKDYISSMAEKHKNDVNQHNQQLKDLKTLLEVQRTENAKELEQKHKLEDSLCECQNLVKKLEEQIQVYEKPKLDLTSEKEIELRAELEAVKDTLRQTEKEVAVAKKEQIRFLETLAKITDPENKMGMQQKLASELLSKEESITKLQNQIRDLSKCLKFSENKCLQYEKNIHDILAFSQSQNPNEDSTYQNLQQELVELRMKLLEATNYNEELNELLIEKDQKLSQQEKTSRAQAKTIKVRENLIVMLKNKENEQTHELANLRLDLERRMKIVDEVNQQIAAKAAEIQELFSTLECKQQQIHRLEKIVLALEEQQRRAQAQRMRHEEKIAALEHELVSENRTNKKFLFF